MSEKKDCGNHGSHKRHRLFRRIFACILGFIILVLFVILVIWLVLRPSKPRFFLQDVSVSQFRISDSNLFTSVIQVTLSSRNPNDRIGIYYDRLHVYAEYKNQQITIPTRLPVGYLGHKDVAIWSPYLYGTDVPVTPYLGIALGQDLNAQFLLLHIKVDGRLRWKVGSWTSGHYHIHVNCPAFLTVSNGKGNNGGSPVFQFQQISSCTVDV